MMNKLRKLREKKGFTLVELIVVIAIIAILPAVIVPLVGRYSAQATYTTLQDAAKTISNSANTVVSDVTMMGSVINSLDLVGAKTSGTLTVNSKTKSDIAASTGDDLVAAKLAESLEATVPDGCHFVVVISNNAVTGVVYSANTTVAKTTQAKRVSGFEDAFVINGTSSDAIGVSGSYLDGAIT